MNTTFPKRSRKPRRRLRTCPSCRGNGGRPRHLDDCRLCHGDGRIDFIP